MPHAALAALVRAACRDFGRMWCVTSNGCFLNFDLKGDEPPEAAFDTRSSVRKESAKGCAG